MSQKRNMPSITSIVSYWNKEYSDDLNSSFCWGCGFNVKHLERAHLLSRANGGSDDSDNLVLLCRFCHSHVQEYFTFTQSESDKVKSMILDGMPFFRIKVAHYVSKVKTGLYDDIIDSIGIDKDEFEYFKDKVKITI
jgi:hypothetical protein